MKDVDQYRKEQDRIFEEIEEMERLERQAIQSTAMRERFERLSETPRQAEFVFRLLQSKIFQGLLDTAASLEYRWEMIEDTVRAWKRHHPEPGTQI